MTESRTITLGGKSFAIPPLPLRINAAAYPLCRSLSNAGLIERAAQAGGALDCTEEEMGQLGDLAFLAVSASPLGPTRDGFDELPITPVELLDAFFAIRYQTGGWVQIKAAEDGDTAGEAKPARRPRKSTSSAS